MEIQKAGSFKFLFLASWLVVAYPVAWAQESPSQNNAADFLAIPLPEVEFDGSALQLLPKAENDAPSLPPVKLTPPDLSRPALPPARRITLIAPEAESPAVISAPVQPMTTTPPAPAPVRIQAPAPVAALPDVPVPGRKPQHAETVAEAPVQKVPVKPGVPAKTETMAAAAPLRELPPPPEVMPMVETAVPTEQSGAVLFPVTSRARVKGVLNPAENPTSPAPAETDQKTARALSAAMAKQATQTKERVAEQAETRGDWWQDYPEIILSSVPYPRKRPTIGMASESFVREARKNLVETYTIVKREGDKMPAMKRAPVMNEKLPAPRLSVADIAGDPLASQLVDMSPEDVARALNAMAPASGREQAHLARELATVAKPRIVRQEGEWIRKGDKAARREQAQEDPAKKLVSIPESAQPLLPGGPVMLVYKEGEVSLPAESAALIEQNVLENLIQSPTTRARIMAYAAASDGREATSRRISLARALAVRSFLMSRGVDATRLDVRAMGLPQGHAEVADKVDIILVPKAESGKKG